MKLGKLHFKLRIFYRDLFKFLNLTIAIIVEYLSGSYFCVGEKITIEIPECFIEICNLNRKLHVYET